MKEFKNFKVAATTLRHVHTATVNDWSAILWHDGKFHESKKYPKLEILDRVGGGDSFASGLQFGFLEFNQALKRKRHLGFVEDVKQDHVVTTVPDLAQGPHHRLWIGE